MTSASLRAGTTATTLGQRLGLRRRFAIVALARQPEAAATHQQVEPDRQRQEAQGRRQVHVR